LATCSCSACSTSSLTGIASESNSAAYS
jgi:hypothetical protein